MFQSLLYSTFHGFASTSRRQRRDGAQTEHMRGIDVASSQAENEGRLASTATRQEEDQVARGTE